MSAAPTVAVEVVAVLVILMEDVMVVVALEKACTRFSAFMKKGSNVNSS